MCAPAKTTAGVYGYSNTAQPGTSQVLSYVPGKTDAWGTPTAGLVNVMRSDGTVGIIPMQQVVQNQNAAISASLGQQKGIAVGGNDQKGGMSYNTYGQALTGKYIRDPGAAASAATTASGEVATSGGTTTQNPTSSSGTTPNQTGGGDTGFTNQGGGVTVVSKQTQAQQGTTTTGGKKVKKTSRQASAASNTIATGSGGLLGKSATGTKDLLGS